MEECYFQSNRRLKPIKIHSGTLLGIGIFHFLRTHYLPCIRGYKILAFRRILRSYSKQLSGSLENSGQPVTWNQGKPENIKEKKWSEESRKSQGVLHFFSKATENHIFGSLVEGTHQISIYCRICVIKKSCTLETELTLYIYGN